MSGFLFFEAAGYEDIYDMRGELIFTGEPLYEFWSYHSPDGGWRGQYYGVWAHRDRFFRDFGSQVTLYEWIDGTEYELRLGRFKTVFTPLTLQKTRFRWGYHEEDWHYFNIWHYDWGRWWDQRSARLRITRGESQWKALVAKTGYQGDQGHQWEPEHLKTDKDRYFTAVRRSLPLFGMKMGFSFVNQRYTDFTTGDDTVPGFFSSKGPFTGLISDNPPSHLYIRITDDFRITDASPYETEENPDFSNVAVYRIRAFVNGKEDHRLRVENGSPAGSRVTREGNFREFGDRVEVSGPWQPGQPGERVVYVFHLPDDVDITSVKFDVTVANDYKIEISRNNVDWQTRFRAPGSVKDYSNRTTLSLPYGDYTATTILGFDIQGIIPGINVPFTAEIASAREFFKYPTAGGERTSDAGYAWYVNLSKPLRPFVFACEIYDFDYNYNAAFAVEDNDNRSDRPDAVDQHVGWFEEDYMMGRADDDFILFRVDRSFREGLDLNNNYAFDDFENDAKPSYPYKTGQRGYILSGAVRPATNLKLQLHFVDEEEKMSDRSNQTIFGKAKYEIETYPVNIGLRHEIKRAQDNIPDDLVTDPKNPDPWANQLVESWQDPLDFRDNLVNTTFATLDFKIIRNLTLVNRYLYGIDQRYYSDRTHHNVEGLLRTSYDRWFPFKNLPGIDSWQVTPMYKLERRNERVSDDGFVSIEGDWRKDAFALVFTNYLTEKTRVFAGRQAVYYNDYLYRRDSTRHVTAIEIIHHNEYWDRPLVVSAGMKFVNQTARLAEDEERYDYYYLKAYFQW